LRNRRLILRLHYYLGTHILGASRGGPCDSTALVYSTVTIAIDRHLGDSTIVRFTIAIYRDNRHYRAPLGPSRPTSVAGYEAMLPNCHIFYFLNRPTVEFCKITDRPTVH